MVCHIGVCPVKTERRQGLKRMLEPELKRNWKMTLNVPEKGWKKGKRMHWAEVVERRGVTFSCPIIGAAKGEVPEVE